MLITKKAINKNSNKNKIITNVYWAIIGKIVNILSGIFIGVLVARYLGPTDYGLMNYVISYITLFTVFSNFGMDSIEIRELAKNDIKRNEIMGTAFCIRLFLSGITVILVFITSYIFETNYNTKVLIWIYSISIILGSFNVIRNYFTAIVFNEYVVKTEISRNLLGASIKIILLLYHASLIWFIVATTLDFLLIGAGYIFSYRTIIGKIATWSFDSAVAKKLIKESFPLLLSGTAIVIYQRIDQVMIGKMINQTSNGYFSVAARFIDFAIFIPAIIAQTVAPMLLESYSNNKEDYFEKRQFFFNVVTWSGIFMSIIMSLSAYWMITILFGKEFIPAVAVLQIMAWKAVGSSLFASSSQIIINEGKQKWAFMRNISALILCIFLNLWLIPLMGINGSAIAGVVTILFSGFIVHIFIKIWYFY